MPVYFYRLISSANILLYPVTGFCSGPDLRSGRACSGRRRGGETEIVDVIVGFRLRSVFSQDCILLRGLHLDIVFKPVGAANQTIGTDRN